MQLEQSAFKRYSYFRILYVAFMRKKKQDNVSIRNVHMITV